VIVSTELPVYDIHKHAWAYADGSSVTAGLTECWMRHWLLCSDYRVAYNMHQRVSYERRPVKQDLLLPFMNRLRSL